MPFRKNHKTLFFLISLFLLYCSPNYKGKQSPTEINTENDKHGLPIEKGKPIGSNESKNTLGKPLTYAIEAYSTLDPATDIEFLQDSGKLKAEVLKPGTIPNFKFTSKIIWLKVKLDLFNPPEGPYMGVIDYPPIDSVLITSYQDTKKLEKHWLGDHHAHSNLAYRKPTFELSGSETHLWVRIQSATSVQFPISIYKERDFLQEKQVDSIEQSFYYGALLSIFIYNVILAFSTRFKMYRYYIGFLFCYGLFQAIFSGYGVSLLWPAAPTFWIDKSLTFFISLVGLFSYLFAFKLLDLNETAPRLYKIGQTIVYLHAPHTIILWFVSYKVGLFWVFLLAFIWSSYLIFISIKLSLRKNRIALIYLIAWFVFILGTIASILLTFNILPRNFFTVYAQQIGSVLEFILLSFTMAFKINQSHKEADNLSTRLSKEAKEKDFLNQTSAVGKYQDIEPAVRAFFGLVKENFNINTLSYLKIDQDAKQIKSVLFDHPEIEDPDFISFRDNFNYQLEKSIGSLYLTYIRKKPLYASKLVDVAKLKSKVDHLIVKVLKFGDFLHIPLVSEKETIGIVFACNYQDKMNLTRNEVKLLNSACQSLSGLFRAYSLNESLTKKVEHNKKLSKSNEELAEQKLKYSKMIGELSFEFAQAGEQLDAAKEEQAQIAKELQEASRQLIQAEKLSGLGAMVSGIAHDINNPLNFIETARFQEQEKLDQLKEHLLGLVPEGEEGEEFKADLLARFEKLGKLNDQIKTGVTRVTEISKSMRNASRADTEKTNDVNLVEVIEESLIITGNKVKQFKLINNIPDGIALATCNRSQIGQVVMNFLSNAADALVEYKEQNREHKGTIQVDLAISNHSDGQNQLKTVQISVSDNGAGVPQENRDKVLNAFFTTKAAGVGTGLGLAICGKIAQAHDGTIHIEDGLPNDQGGHGARFTLEFVG